MQAMVLHHPLSVAQKPLVLADVPALSPTATQIRLRVQACGVCHTDLHIVEGDLPLPQLPLIPGHQVVGVVEVLGERATRYKLGDRVGVGWLYGSCGGCKFCRHGQENLCPQAQFTGLHVNGGYAETVTVDEQFAYSIPNCFSDVEAAPLLCAGIIGYRSLRLSQIQPGGKLGLYGFGASAHLAIQVARHWGCEVYVFTRSQNHRQLARQLGAVWAGDAAETVEKGLDASILFAPIGSLVPSALRHLRPGGTLAINAIHLTPIPEMAYPLLYGERVLRSVANFTRQDAAEFLQLAAQIPIRTEVTSYPFTQANEALFQLKRSRIQGAAVLQMST